jgi:transcriptional regulator with XRE-family HTH domain
MSKIGKKLRILRQQQGLTTRELGAKLGVSNSYIVRIENGKKRPSIDLVAKMARFFNVSTDQLIMDELELDEKNDDQGL